MAKNPEGTLTPKELSKKISSKSMGGIFLFYGEEQYRLESALAAIKKKIIAKGTEAFNLFKFGADVSAADIADAVRQFPQMSDMKMIIVRNSGLLNNAVLNDFKLIKNLEVSDDTCLIFTELDFDKKKLKNVKFIADSGGIVIFDKMSEKELMVWVEKRFRAVEKSASDRDMLYLVNLCARSQAEIEQACDKLINYTGERNKITREDIDAVVEKSVDFLVYDMVNSVIDRRVTKAWEQLKYLESVAGGKSVKRKTASGKSVRIDPNNILGIMMTQLSELLCCKLLKEDGLSSAEIGGYFDFPRPAFAVNNTITKSRDFDECYLKRMIDKGLYYDVECKSGKLAPWAAVEMYVAELLESR